MFTRVVFYAAWFALGAIMPTAGLTPKDLKYWAIMAAALTIHLAG